MDRVTAKVVALIQVPATSAPLPLLTISRVSIPVVPMHLLATLMLRLDVMMVPAYSRAVLSQVPATTMQMQHVTTALARSLAVPISLRATMMRLQDAIMVPAYSPVAPMSLLVTIILQRAVMMAHVFYPMVAPTLQLVTLTLPLYATMALACIRVALTQLL